MEGAGGASRVRGAPVFPPQTWRESVKLLKTLSLVGAIGAATMGSANAVDISGAGATFPYPIYAKWADAYKKQTGVGLNYQSIGSGGGIKQITARTVTFGASDMPLQPEELDKIGCMQFPTVMGGIVPVVNLAGIQANELVIDGPTLAKIYLGEIKKWNDPALTKLNPSAKLPDQAIAIVHRSDGSGTTFIFTNYLSKVSPEWKSKVGSNTSVDWPGGIGAKGNEGVSNNVGNTKGSIGYVETAYAKQNHLTTLKMVNKDGKTVSAVPEAIMAAAAGADWEHAPRFYMILTDSAGAQAWPIAGATFILVPKQPKDAAATKQALDFFAWAYKNGGEMAASLDYIPMPPNVVSLIQARWKSDIKDDGGHPIY
jgi:phosphate transport system substrate-binding protein